MTLETIYQFDAYFHDASFLRNGDMRLILRVPAREVPDMILLTQARGLKLNVEASHAMRPEPAPSRLTISQVRALKSGDTGGDE